MLRYLLGIDRDLKILQDNLGAQARINEAFLEELKIQKEHINQLTIQNNGCAKLLGLYIGKLDRLQAVVNRLSEGNETIIFEHEEIGKEANAETIKNISDAFSNLITSKVDKDKLN